MNLILFVKSNSIFVVFVLLLPIEFTAYDNCNIHIKNKENVVHQETKKTIKNKRMDTYVINSDKGICVHLYND